MDSYVLAWGVIILAAVLMTVVGFVALVYVSARAAGIGWYRSRLEHMRKVWRSIGRDGGDGLL